MLRIVFAVIALVLFTSFGSFCPSAIAESARKNSSNDQKSTSKVSEAVVEVIRNQQEAWNKGDLAAFLSAYAHSKTVTYVSNSSVFRGYDEIEKRYQSRYGDKKETMGHLTLSELEISEMGNKHVLCVGKFGVENKEQKPIYGRFTLILEKFKDGWKIIYDHSSV